MKERKFRPCLTKQLLNMFQLRCEWGLSHISSHIFGFLRHISSPRFELSLHSCKCDKNHHQGIHSTNAFSSTSKIQMQMQMYVYMVYKYNVVTCEDAF